MEKNRKWKKSFISGSSIHTDLSLFNSMHVTPCNCRVNCYAGFKLLSWPTFYVGFSNFRGGNIKKSANP